jgi:hypothetical protein
LEPRLALTKNGDPYYLAKETKKIKTQEDVINTQEEKFKAQDKSFRDKRRIPRRSTTNRDPLEFDLFSNPMP